MNDYSPEENLNLYLSDSDKSIVTVPSSLSILTSYGLLLLHIFLFLFIVLHFVRG